MPLILVLLIAISAVVIFVLYKLIARWSRDIDVHHLSSGQRILFFVVVLYAPVQLILLLSIGHHLPIGRVEDHIPTALVFSTLHIILPLMGAVASKRLMTEKRIAVVPYVANLCAALFYTLSTIILVAWVAVPAGTEGSF